MKFVWLVIGTLAHVPLEAGTLVRLPFGLTVCHPQVGFPLAFTTGTQEVTKPNFPGIQIWESLTSENVKPIERPLREASGITRWTFKFWLFTTSTVPGVNEPKVGVPGPVFGDAAEKDCPTM